MKQPDTSEHKPLTEVLDMLVADGLIAQPDADKLIAEKPVRRQDEHPLLVISRHGLKSLKLPHNILHLEALTEWLAGRAGLEYVHIDPLKIDLSSVTEIMSSDYAARFAILPLQVAAGEVVVATAEPYLREWEKVLKPILRKEIRRVLANPLDTVSWNRVEDGTEVMVTSKETFSGILSSVGGVLLPEKRMRDLTKTILKDLKKASEAYQ